MKGVVIEGKKWQDCGVMKKIDVTVIRHARERLSKCSLEALRGRSEIRFIRASGGLSFDCTGYLLLAVGAPELTVEDRGHPILLLDSTWRLLPELERCLVGAPIRRSLPGGVKTAYPRVSKVFSDPLQGLASVEALYLAKRILGEDDPSLLDGYYWKDAFLEAL